MNRVNTKCEIDVYEVNDKERPIGGDWKLTVKSHWNRKEFVLLNFRNDITITVSASDLISAIDRCSE